MTNNMKNANWQSAKSNASKLIKYIIKISQNPREFDSSGSTIFAVRGEEYPQLGKHYIRDQVISSESYQELVTNLVSSDYVSEAWDDSYPLERVIIQLIDAILASLEWGIFDDSVFDFWWGKFVKALSAESFTVRTIVGLSNFEATKDIYEFGEGKKIHFLGEYNLSNSIRNFINVWNDSKISTALHNKDGYKCKGVLVFDSELPVTNNNLNFTTYEDELINIMTSIVGSLRLSGPGGLLGFPWIIAVNPEFPIRPIYPVGNEQISPTGFGPIFLLDDKTFDRFLNIYGLISKLQFEDEMDVQDFRSTRRKIKLATSRFSETYEKYRMLDNIIDLVIALEALFSGRESGGSLKIAMYCSNLLGLSNEESIEILDNIQKIYKFRNKIVHGEPITTQKWDDFISNTIHTSKIEFDGDRFDKGLIAFEIIRDYVRRSIIAMLNLHQSNSYKLNRDLLDILFKLHLDSNKKKEIQGIARCYPFEKTRVKFREDI